MMEPRSVLTAAVKDTDELFSRFREWFNIYMGKPLTDAVSRHEWEPYWNCFLVGSIARTEMMIQSRLEEMKQS